MALSPHFSLRGTVAHGQTPHTRKISIPLINNLPGKNCLVRRRGRSACRVTKQEIFAENRIADAFSPALPNPKRYVTTK
jgi:FAD synthase